MAQSVISLKNECLTADISTHGAEIVSLKSLAGTEFIWGADPKVWACHTPVLFPICGGLKDDEYVLSGVTYHMPKHGFAKMVDYKVEQQTETRAVLCYTPDEEHKAMFPFEYEFRVIFTLSGSSLSVSYDVTSKDSRTMYFSVGAHEGYACPGGIEGYSVIFEKEENLDRQMLDGNLLSDDVVRMAENTNVLPLKNDYFEADAAVFKHLKSRRVTLKENGGSRSVTVEFPGHDFFLLWTKVGAEYICLEPWCGVQDPVDSDKDITKKEGIISLCPGGHYAATHTITVKE